MKEKESSFADEVLNEFDRYFGNHDNSMFNVWKIGDAITSEKTYHKLKEFILENMHEAEKRAVEIYDRMIDAEHNAKTIDGEFNTDCESVRKEALAEFGINE